MVFGTNECFGTSHFRYSASAFHSLKASQIGKIITASPANKIGKVPENPHHVQALRVSQNRQSAFHYAFYALRDSLATQQPRQP